MGAEEVNYVIKKTTNWNERIVFGLTGSINGDTSKIFKFDSTSMIGKRNATLITLFGGYVLYKMISGKSKKKKS